MPHRSSIFFGAIFFGGLMLIAWLEYYPSSRMFEVLGMPGPRANSSRQCEALQQPRVISLMPSRIISCHGPFFSTNNVHLSEAVSVNRVTRKLMGASRMWTVPDSAGERDARDSVALALARLGGKPFACEKGKDWFPQSFERKYWRFSGFYVRWLAVDSEQNAPDLPRWMLELTGTPTIPWECAREWREPPLEAGCGAEAVIRMPLPGNRLLCVKSSLWN